MFRLLFGSLRSKITFGYVALGVLFIGLAAFALAQLEAIEAQMAKQRTVAAFFDTVRDVRGLERSLFLHRKQNDFREAMRQVNNAIWLVDAYHSNYEEIAPPERIQSLRARLEDYGRRLNEYWQVARTRPSQAKEMEESVREGRVEFMEVAEDLSRSADRALAEELRQYRLSLIASIGVVAFLVLVAGHLLSRSVARPLKNIEKSMEAIADGQLGKLELRAADKEIASLTTAFNHVLSELQARQDEMLRSEKLASLGTMLSGVAHELNNPLSNISTSTQILIEEIEQPNSPYQRELLQQIDDQTERARRIVSTLLEFARDRAFRRESVPLLGVLEDTLRLFAGQVPANVKVELKVPEKLCVHADKQRMQQVFLNLIKNAVEASPGGGTVRVAAAEFGPEIKRDPFQNAMQERFVNMNEGMAGIDIEVSDQGSGIAEEVLPRIFDPFFSTKDVGKGCGLGLFVVHEIISEHGGHIVAESEPGRGTRFYIRLPNSTAAKPREVPRLLPAVIEPLRSKEAPLAGERAEGAA